VSDINGTYTLGYDALGRKTAQTDIWGLTLTYSYDNADRLTQVQDSKNGVLTSVCDSADRLTSRQFGGTGMTQARIDIGYDNRNEMTSLTRYSDVAGTTLLGTSAYNYDNSGRVTNITHKNAAGATLSYYNYSFDSADRVTSQSWQSGSNSGSQTYTYDSTNQLLGDGTNTWSYDANGNRTNTGYVTGTDNRLSNDVVAGVTWNNTYDNAGNLIQKTNAGGSETWTYSYDNLNHLISVTQVVSGVTQLQVTYTYDVFANRVQDSTYKPSTGTVVTRHAYDGSNVWADLDTSNNVLVRYIYRNGADQVFARIVTSGANAGLAFYLTDRLGSVRDLVDTGPKPSGTTSTMTAMVT
jgi:YD repeat-containing protein